MFNILVCDDERDIAAALNIYLKAEGYRVTTVSDGLQALEAVRAGGVDLVLLDIMMPVMDGIEALSAIRAESNVPVILLTAKSEDSDKILGLNIGADDYITKPFKPAEVTARVRSHLRRYTQLGSAVQNTPRGITVGAVSLYDDEKLVTLDGEPVNLTPLEYSILKLLMENPGKVFSSGEIYRQVWNESCVGSEGTVSVHIRHLREKLEIDPAEPRFLKVVWGQGYKIEK